MLDCTIMYFILVHFESFENVIFVILLWSFLWRILVKDRCTETLCSRDYFGAHMPCLLGMQHIYFITVSCNDLCTFFSGKVVSDTWLHRSFCIIIIIIIISSACYIRVSNTTCYCNLICLLSVFIYICSLGWFIFTKSIEFMFLNELLQISVG